MDGVTDVTSLNAQRDAFQQVYGVTQSQTQTTSKAAEQKLNFLNLLITQMKNQNPLEPLDNNQMVSQLAQMTQLEEMETLNATLKDALSANQAGYAASIIGKTITFVPEGQTLEQAAAVAGVEMVDGEIRLIAGGNSVPLASVHTISGAAAGTPTA